MAQHAQPTLAGLCAHCDVLRDTNEALRAQSLQQHATAMAELADTAKRRKQRELKARVREAESRIAELEAKTKKLKDNAERRKLRAAMMQAKLDDAGLLDDNVCYVLRLSCSNCRA